MMRKGLKRFIDLYRSHWLIQMVLVVSVVGPMVLIAVFSYRATDRQMTEQALGRRQDAAFAAAATLRGHFDRYAGIGTSFASTEQLRHAVADGDWKQAGTLIKGIPAEFPAVDRVILTGTTGTVEADTATADIGRDLSGEDWFKKLSERRQPYVSRIYHRETADPANVFAVAVPVKASSDADSAGIGTLAMEIRTETLLEWAKSMDAGLSGYAYFVDNRGNLAAHPTYPPQGRIVNFSDVPAVQQVRLGRSGVETRDGDVIAYEPIKEYGWGVVLVQPVAAAFLPRTERLSLIFFVFGLILAVNLALAFGILLITRMMKEAYQREKAFVEAAGEGIVATDASGRLIMMNPQAEALLGWTREELMGQSFIEKVPIEDERGEPIPLTFRPLLYALKLGQKKTTTTTPTHYYVRKDGTRFPAALSASPIMEGKKVTGAVSMFRDITAEKEIDMAKSEFVSLASHQLLSPLSAVKGYAHLLNEGDMGPIDQAQKTVTMNILDLVERMISLVNALLNVSRIELGTFAVEPEAVDLRRIAESVIFELAGQIEAKKIDLRKQFDRELPTVNADPNLLRIVFQNILTNAVRYSSQGGIVKIAIEKRPAVMYITVSDQGIGIPQQQQKKIFGKFFRADNARVRMPDGNGLGLYIAKAILENTGGKIWFTSEENRGTTFFVTIPREGMLAREGSKKLGYKE